MNQEELHKPVTLKTFLALTMADIDICLLKEKDQETDKDKLYTKEEIREQLKSTMNRVLNLDFMEHLSLINVPLIEALQEKSLRNAGFSEYEISNFKNNKL